MRHRCDGMLETDPEPNPAHLRVASVRASFAVTGMSTMTVSPSGSRFRARSASSSDGDSDSGTALYFEGEVVPLPSTGALAMLAGGLYLRPQV